MEKDYSRAIFSGRHIEVDQKFFFTHPLILFQSLYIDRMRSPRSKKVSQKTSRRQRRSLRKLRGGDFVSPIARARGLTPETTPRVSMSGDEDRPRAMSIVDELNAEFEQNCLKMRTDIDQMQDGNLRDRLIVQYNNSGCREKFDRVSVGGKSSRRRRTRRRSHRKH